MVFLKKIVSKRVDHKSIHRARHAVPVFGVLRRINGILVI